MLCGFDCLGEALRRVVAIPFCNGPRLLGQQERPQRVQEETFQILRRIEKTQLVPEKTCNSAGLSASFPEVRLSTVGKGEECPALFTN